MSFWNTSENVAVVATTSFESQTDMEPIPNNTLLRSVVTEAKWKDTTDRQQADGKGDRCINLRWDVIDGEYKNRVVFQNIWVSSIDGKKRDKAIEMLAAIDANAGGKLMQLGREPSDIEMMSNLCNKPMVVRTAVWMKDDDNGVKIPGGNWINAVFDPKTPTPKAAPKKPAAAQGGVPGFDDDLDF